jgi:hypothetical protein
MLSFTTPFQGDLLRCSIILTRSGRDFACSSTMLGFYLHRTALFVLSSPSRCVSNPADHAVVSHPSFAADFTSFTVRTLDVFVSTTRWSRGFVPLSSATFLTQGSIRFIL